MDSRISSRWRCVLYVFYKKILALDLGGTNCHFSGAPIGYEDEEDICVYDIEFYKAGTVNRGSYEIR